MGKELDEMLKGKNPSGTGDVPAGDNPGTGDVPSGDNLGTGDVPVNIKQEPNNPLIPDKGGDIPAPVVTGEKPVEGGDTPPVIEKPLIQEVNIDSINRAIDGTYSSIEEVKNRLNQIDDMDSLRARETQYMDLIESVTNPMSLFADEKLFKLNEIRKQNPGISSFVVNQLLEADSLKEMDGLQILVLKHVMDVPSHQRNIGDVKDLLSKRYGLDIDLNSIEDDDDRAAAQKTISLNKLEMEADAERAKKEFSALMDIKLPDKKKVEDLIAGRQSEREAILEKIKVDFKPIADGLSKSLTNIKLQYPDGNVAIDFSVPDTDKSSLYNGILDAAVKMGLNPGSTEDVTKLGSYARNYIVANNLSKILKAHELNIVAMMKSGEYEKHNVVNPGSPEGIAPEPGNFAETNEEIVRREMKKK